MKEKIDTLVEKYYNFLQVRLEAEKEDTRMKFQPQTIIAFIIMVIVFGEIGFLTKQLWNIYYVFFSVNTIIICSFVFNNYVTEQKIKKKYDFTYDTYISIAYGTATLIGILGLFNAIYIGFYYGGPSIYPIVIIGLLMFSFGFIIANNLEHRIRLVEPHRIVRNAIYITIWFGYLFYFIDGNSFGLKYALSTVIVLGVYIIKYLFSLLNITNGFVESLMFIGSVILLISSVTNFSYVRRIFLLPNEPFPVLETDVSNLVIAEEEIGDYHISHYLGSTSEFHFFKNRFVNDGDVMVTDHDLNILYTVTIPEKIFVDAIYVDNDTLKMFGYEHDETETLIFEGLFELIDGEFVREKEINEDRFDVLEYDDMHIRLNLDYNNHFYGYMTVYLDYPNYENVFFSQLDTGVIYKNDHYSVFKIGEEVYFEQAYFEKGYIAINDYDKREFHIYLLEDYIYDREPTLTIEVDSNITDIGALLVTDEYFVVGANYYEYNFIDTGYLGQDYKYLVIDRDTNEVIEIHNRIYEYMNSIYVYDWDNYYHYDSDLVGDVIYESTPEEVLGYIKLCFIGLMLIGNNALLPISWWRDEL